MTRANKRLVMSRRYGMSSRTINIIISSSVRRFSLSLSLFLYSPSCSKSSRCYSSVHLSNVSFELAEAGERSDGSSEWFTAPLLLPMLMLG